MIGRAAQGRPWIFREVEHYLKTGTYLPPPLVVEVSGLMDAHLREHYAFYGEFMGVRTARKHIGWYVQDVVGGEEFRQEMNLLTSCDAQLKAVKMFFDRQANERLQYRPSEDKWAA
jgi:tRNA-dihydrouridine synthase B